MFQLPKPILRRTSRHTVRSTQCQAVHLDGFRLLGQRLIDCSTGGVLLACDEGVSLGDDVLVSFQVPTTRRWFDAEAKVVRIVEGFREGDPGYCAGLRFTEIENAQRLALGVELRCLPPTYPQRAPRSIFS